jgi:hypothetical protein
MPTGERCLEREELERVVGAYIESIFRTSLAIERTPQMKGWSKRWTFTATKARRALEVLFTHRKQHGC